MPTSRTVTGKAFDYSGSLAEGLTVTHASGHATRVRAATIGFVMAEIERRSPVLMGANRQPLVRDSLGESVRTELGQSPQILSYLIPLLTETGFCRVTKSGRNYVVHRR